ncbi:MAG: MarR family transcriptional regulator [Dongia sp.]|jgi:DNA-binding MarR family transcriptional regulator
MNERSDLADAARAVTETCLCHRARMAARAVTRGYDLALRETGLRATQLAVLAAIAARGALSIKALADDLGMDRTTLTRNLRPLEDLGYVAIGAEARHRSRTLALTESGDAALAAALPLWEQAQRAMQQRLGARRWPEIGAALTDLTAGA